MIIPNSDRKLWISPSCAFNIRGEVGQNFIELASSGKEFASTPKTALTSLLGTKANAARDFF